MIKIDSFCKKFLLSQIKKYNTKVIEVLKCPRCNGKIFHRGFCSTSDNKRKCDVKHRTIECLNGCFSKAYFCIDDNGEVVGLTKCINCKGTAFEKPFLCRYHKVPHKRIVCLNGCVPKEYCVNGEGKFVKTLRHKYLNKN
jgi:hypothetical protein